MQLESKKIILKDGREAILRSPVREDAEKLLAYMRKTTEETHFVLRYPEECTLTVEKETVFVENINSSDSDMMISCFVDGELAGNCQVSCGARIKTSHRASVAIGIIQKYWNLGIGTAMFREMTAFAESKGIMQMELEYIEGNDRARRLYEKAGFVEYGQRPDAIKLKDGTMLKEILMLKKLK